MKLSSKEKNYSEIIKKCYLDLLYREPDTEGFNYFLNLFKNGNLDEIGLIENIKNSDEYKITPRRIDLNKFDDKRNETNIVAMYRIKNVDRWIAKSLEYASEVCKEIVVLDDGSTDDTLKICKKYKNVVDIHHQTGLPFDETRDRNILLKMALKRKPDFVITIDGDEILMPNSKEILFKEINLIYPTAPVFSFQFIPMWEKPNQFLDKGNKLKWHDRMVRIQGQPKDMHFEQTNFPGNVHSSNGLSANKSLAIVRSAVKINHYGCYTRTLREQKYEWLSKLDPNNGGFDRYRGILTNVENPKVDYLPEGEFDPDII